MFRRTTSNKGPKPKVLTYETLNQNMKQCKYEVRGEIYLAAVKRTNINELLSIRGLARNRWLTDFWYNLHNDVNSRSNKSAFLKDDLKNYDDKIGFELAYDMIKKVVAKGIEHGALHMLVAKNGLSRIETLRRVYGL